MTDPPTETGTRAHVVEVATSLNERIAEVTREMKFLLSAEIEELAGDPKLVELMGASIEGNVENILHALRHEISGSNIEPPSAAIEYARRLAQRGVPVNALVRAYRLGQQFLLELAFAESERLPASDQARSEAYGELIRVTFTYIDWISQRVVSTYEQEREAWLSAQNSSRVLRVEEILAGADFDVDAAESATRFRLRQLHVGLVLWGDEPHPGQDLGQRLTHFVRGLASSISSDQPPLTIERDRTTVWGWLQLHDAAELELLAEVARHNARRPEQPAVRIALGTAQQGVAGFRRTHQEALEAHRVSALHSDAADRVVGYADPGVGLTALLTRDLSGTRTWVQRVLGPLATDDGPSQRHRETLRIFFANERSFTATAQEMCMHKNSIKYRVDCAQRALGRSIAVDRQSVEAALTVCHFLGSTVLAEAP